MKNKIEDLRNHLFSTLEALQDSEKPMDLERAKAIADVAQVIVNSAKVEVSFLQAVEGDKSDSKFFAMGMISNSAPAPRVINGAAGSARESKPVPRFPALQKEA